MNFRHFLLPWRPGKTRRARVEETVSPGLDVSPTGAAPVPARRPPKLVRRARWWNAPWFDTVQFLVLCGALIWLVVSGAMGMDYHWQWYRVPQFIFEVVDGELLWGPLAKGLAVTLKITACSVVLALAIGLVTALLRLSDSLAGRAVSKVYIEAVRNTPLLIQMYLFYFVLGPIIGLDRFWVGVACLSVFEGAFACEVIRAGVLSVPRGQHEASDSLGLGRAQGYRYVILPLAVPLMLPPLTGLIISLVKNSAIVSVIAVFDLTTAGRNLVADTFLSFEIWMTVAAIYLGLTVALSVFMSYLERRVRTCA
ncbi:MAG: amino acid ABC transporter permease [Bryobacterales bacterium]|nr:amino acid ABC transporter permease [Bryobacterales bacterium]